MQIIIIMIFFGPLLWGDIFFDHLLWFIFQSSLHTCYTLQIMLDCLCGQLFMPEPRTHNGIIYSYSNSNNSVTYFQCKILALARIWTRDLPGKKANMLTIELSWLGFCKLFLWCKKFHRIGPGLCIFSRSWLLQFWTFFVAAQSGFT